MKLTPVDYDPFAREPAKKTPRLVPVDYDPFAPTAQERNNVRRGLNPDGSRLQPGAGHGERATKEDQEAELLAAEESHRRMLAARPRTKEQVVTDTALSMGSGALNALGGLVDVANTDYGTKLPPQLEGLIATGASIAGRFGNKNARDISDLMAANAKPSSEYAASFANTAKEYAGDARSRLSEQRQASDQALSEAKGVAGKAAYLFDNPSKVVELGLDSIPYIAAGGFVGRVAGAAGESAAVGSNLATQGVMSASSSAQEARSMIDQLPDEELAALPEYQELLDKYEPNVARKILSQRANDQAFATGLLTNAVTLGLTAKMPSLERIMHGGAGGSTSRLVNAGRTGFTEFGQEGLQGGGEQLATNVGASASDSRVGLTDKLGEAALLEGVVGGPMGVAGGFVQTPAQEQKRIAEDLKAQRAVASTPEQAGTLDAGIALAEARAGKAETKGYYDRMREAQASSQSQPVSEQTTPSASSGGTQQAQGVDQDAVDSEELTRLLADAFPEDADLQETSQPDAEGQETTILASRNVDEPPQDDGLESEELDPNDPIVARILAEQEAGMAARGLERKEGPSDALTEGFRALAKNPELFRSGMLKSGKEISEIAPQNGIQYGGVSNVDSENGLPYHKVTVDQGAAGKRVGKIYTVGNDVWIDVSDLESGAGGGEAVYNTAQSLAVNTGRNFIQDPLGLSQSAMFRRPIQQTAAIMKADSAENFPVGEFLARTEADGPQTRPITEDARRRINPSLREHLLTTYQNATLAVPEVKGIRYDAATEQFVDRSGNPFSNSDFDRLAAYRQSTPVGSAMVGKRDGSKVRDRAAPVGRNTLKVAALVETLMGATDPNARSALVDKLRSIASRGAGTGALGQLTNILPSRRAEDGNVRPENARSTNGGVLGSQQRSSDGRGRNDTSAEGVSGRDSSIQGGNERVPSAVSVGAIRDAITKAFGRRAKRLLDSGRTKIVQSRDEIPANIQAKLKAVDSVGAGTIQGFYHSGTGDTYIIADTIKNLDEVGPLLLHEEGVHAGMKGMLGDKFPSIARRLKSIQNSGTADEKAIVEKAQKRVTRAGTPEQHADEELVAYTVQLAEAEAPAGSRLRQWLEDVYAAIKLWASNHGLVNLSVNDIRLIARGALGHRARMDAKPSVVPSKKSGNFYSALSESVTQAKGAPKKGTAQQWKEWLDGAQRRGEFKQSERDWLGVDSWLDGRGETTKAELQDFVRANQVQVKETVLGDEKQTALETANKELIEYLVENKEFDQRGANDYALDAARGELSSGQIRAMDARQSELVDALKAAYETRNENAQKSGPTKFASYQLPGGKNYHELLITLPPRQPADADAAFKAYQAELREKYGDDDNIMRKLEPSEMKKLNDLGAPLRDANDTSKQYRSSHFDQTNILAHVRFNERTDADGKRVLFVEEVQSDWHQAGRKKGYGGAEIDQPRAVETSPGEWQVMDGRGDSFDEGVWFDSREGALGAVDHYRSKMTGSVPDAPLKKEWPLTAMKRVIRHAAENGFDRVAWTTGEQQAERYDLSKQIASVNYRDPVDGKYKVTILGLDGHVVGIKDEALTLGQIEDTVGKEIAKKIEAGEGARHTDFKRLSGDGLKVGGEGMKAFYDKMLPNEVGKYVKKWGGKVGQAQIPTGGGKPTDYADFSDYVSKKDGKLVAVHSIDIMPQMRESVMEGQPLFSKKDTITVDGKDDSILASRFTPDERIDEARRTASDKRKEAASSLGVTGPSFTWGLDEGRFKDGMKGAFNRLREQFQDKYLSVLGAQGDIEAVTGNLIEESQNVYRRENLMHGRVSDQIEALHDGKVAPLKKLMKKAKVTSEQVEDYLEARAAEDRNKRIAEINPSMPDGGAGITTDDAKAFLDGKAEGYRSKEKLTPELKTKVEAIVKRIDEIRDETRSRLLQSGQITREQYKALSPTYAPLRGKEGEELGGLTNRVGGGVDVRGKPLKRAMGRGEGNRAVNIIAEILGDAERSIVQAEKTRVGQTLLRLVLANPNKEVWEVEPVKVEQKYSEAKDLVYEAIKAIDNDPGSVRVMVDGKPYRIVLKDTRMAEAIKNLGAEQVGFVIRMMAAVNRYFSAILTRYNPSFVPINMLRDLGMGIIGITSEHGLKAGVDAMVNYTPAMRALWRQARGKPMKGQSGVYAKEFSDAGGKTGFHAYQNVEEMAQQFKDELSSFAKIIRDKDVTALNRLARTYRKGAKGIKESAIIQVIEDANDTIENGMRLAAFIARRKKGSSIEVAAEYAKNITVNFNRRGHATSTANAIFLFFNAATQGSTRTFQLLKQPKVMGTMVALGSLQYVLAALAMGLDDEDEDGVTAWEKISDYDKERNLIFPIVGEKDGKMKVKLIKIPMSYGFNFFPYLGGRLAQSVHGSEKPDAWKLANDLSSAAVDSVSPVKFTGGTRGYLPYLANIFVSLGYNENDFGSKITNVQPYSRYPKPRAALGRASTPEFYHKAATALNRLGGGDEVTPPKIMDKLLDWSPEDLKYITEAFTGGIGRTVDQTITLGQKTYAGLDVGSGDIPILKSLVSDVDMERSTQNIYYDRSEKIAREIDRAKNIYYTEGKDALIDQLSSTPELDGVQLHKFKSGKVENKAGHIQLDAKKDSGYYAFKKAEKALEEVSTELKAARGISDMKERLRKVAELEAKREEMQREFNIKWSKK